MRTVPARINRLCGILTTAADEWVSPYHHRMPLLVHPRHYDAWLAADTHRGDLERITEQSFDDGLFTVYAVSHTVNNPKNQGPECVRQSDGNT